MKALFIFAILSAVGVHAVGGTGSETSSVSDVSSTLDGYFSHTQSNGKFGPGFGTVVRVTEQKNDDESAQREALRSRSRDAKKVCSQYHPTCHGVLPKIKTTRQEIFHATGALSKQQFPEPVQIVQQPVVEETPKPQANAFSQYCAQLSAQRHSIFEKSRGASSHGNREDSDGELFKTISPTRSTSPSSDNNRLSQSSVAFTILMKQIRLSSHLVQA